MTHPDFSRATFLSFSGKRKIPDYTGNQIRRGREIGRIRCHAKKKLGLKTQEESNMTDFP